jgi:hypothetical protein
MDFELFAVTHDEGIDFSGHVSIEVGDHDLDKITVTVRPDSDVTGRVIIEKSESLDGIALSQILVSGVAQSRLTVDLTFHAGLSMENSGRPLLATLQATPAGDTFTFEGAKSWFLRRHCEGEGQNGDVSETMRQLYLKSITAVAIS